MQITISFRGKSQKPPVTVDLPEDSTVDDLKKAIYKKVPKFYPDRQRLSFNEKTLQEGKPLKEYDITNGENVVLKDLGPQISWKTVFLIEYLGPLLIHPIFYYFKSQIYGENFEHSQMQKFAFYMIMTHFGKRELETLFVHRFSHGTMPFMNVFKNSFHYHALSGINLAYWVYGPWNASGTLNSAREEWYIWTCVAVFVYAQISNFSTHITLRNLRPPGTRVRKIPYGYGFELVSCPNYFFETVAWISICALTNSLAAWFFIVVGFFQMYLWAIKKHKAYRKEFKDYPKNRRAIIPFLV
ncbi:3-oxo-5-alpha-steroid 4-dehydrogenase-domain-containing protein [Gigaspora rosea]|uniref:3-oxo-5-alpha-steroid 4-dehydrogenase-domain-containing protein n=1 Tax=Gigaspora rosea TaxID=44941 RepID=A0A397U5U0_9GLOM|nr:3-oxo-5-alpha-steroid 4-dehydrogenase-domain-containing protein [Gigaspora rosea]